MKSQQLKLKDQTSWQLDNGEQALSQAQLVLAFMDPALGEAESLMRALESIYPKADIIACSSGGEILGTDVVEGSAVATALAFDKTPTRLATATVETNADSFDAGCSLGQQLAADDLAGLFVISEGLHVNGSELVRGLREHVSQSAIITGGLAGDGANFGTTRVGVNGPLRPGSIAAVGFYGDSIRLAHGNAGGWEEFGPQRRITRASQNVLYELDGKPALDLYKKYLGDDAKDLPSSGLLFPLKICSSHRDETAEDHDAVRTILGISEEEQSLTFAGDIPEGENAQLMMGNLENLISGAGDAAVGATPGWTCASDESVALLVSCIGRKLLLGQRTAEELEAVADRINGIPTIGFYSYGELSPHVASGICELHNQTMTITLLGEA
ncbi:MAG: FIST signal transduction protein [Candidatus Phaeomarinobacter sp.]